MKADLLMDFTANTATHTVHVKREFDAPLADVWAAWTEKELLDQWWAPKPFQARTKTMDFREGGLWHYAMVGPQGEEHWCRADYKSIRTHNDFKCIDAFCDAEANVNPAFPRSDWHVKFLQAEEVTLVEVEIGYVSREAMEKMIEMGFQHGFTAALTNLDALLAK